MTENKFWHGGDVKPSQLEAEAIKLTEQYPDRIGRSTTGSCAYTEYETAVDEVLGVRMADFNKPIQPVCIVGTAVYNVLSKFVSPELEGTRIISSSWVRALGGDTLDHWGDLVGFSDEEEQAAYERLMGMQSLQDSNVPWGLLRDQL